MAPMPLILLIEDDEPLAGMLSAHLEAHHYRVTVSPTAEAAQSTLAAGLHPDVVLLDINLPGEAAGRWSAATPSLEPVTRLSSSPARWR